MSFQDLKLSPALCRTVEARGYTTPTPVQAQSIPVVLAGNDLLAAAQTGTGKTAAFALPILQRLEARGTTKSVAGHPRVLVLTPTRELAMQVQESFRTYGKATPIRSLAVFGGAGMVPQTQSLRRGVDIVVATPGRLLDHMGQGNVSLSRVEILVLDEADRMLDMGFMPDLERILGALPEQRQSLLFSATFPKEIRDLATRLLRDPVEVQIARPNSAAPQVSHALHMVEREEKKDLLIDMLSSGSDRQALIFCRTRHGSDRLCRQLQRAGFAAAAIHGDKSQAARTRALGEFKSGRTSVLVATDVAARGLDIRQLPLVVNYDLPQVPEDYIHRIGRTGRAGEVGRAVSLVSRGERELLREIERLLNRSIEVAARPPRAAVLTAAMADAYSDVASSDVVRFNAARSNPARSNGARSNPAHSNGARSTGARSNGASSDVARAERMPGRPHRPAEAARSSSSNRTRRSNRSGSAQVSRPAASDRHPSSGRRTNQDRYVAHGGGASRSGQATPTEPRRDRNASQGRFASADRRASRDRHAGSDRPMPQNERPRSDRGIPRGGSSDRRDRPSQSHAQPRKNNKFAVSFASAKGKPFWWPFAGKRRPGEGNPPRTGSSRPRARRDDWSPSESGEQA